MSDNQIHGSLSPFPADVRAATEARRRSDNLNAAMKALSDPLGDHRMPPMQDAATQAGAKGVRLPPLVDDDIVLGKGGTFPVPEGGFRGRAAGRNAKSWSGVSSLNGDNPNIWYAAPVNSEVANLIRQKHAEKTNPVVGVIYPAIAFRDMREGDVVLQGYEGSRETCEELVVTRAALWYASHNCGDLLARKTDGSIKRLVHYGNEDSRDAVFVLVNRPVKVVTGSSECQPPKIDAAREEDQPVITNMRLTPKPEKRVLEWSPSLGCTGPKHAMLGFSRLLMDIPEDATIVRLQIEISKGVGVSVADMEALVTNTGKPTEVPEMPMAGLCNVLPEGVNVTPIRTPLESVCRGISMGLVAEERARQISVEGFSVEDNDRWRAGELGAAAYGYIQLQQWDHPESQPPPSDWPFPPEWWKPSSDPICNLTKGLALGLAEIDRLLRLQIKKSKKPAVANIERSTLWDDPIPTRYFVGEIDKSLYRLWEGGAVEYRLKPGEQWFSVALIIPLDYVDRSHTQLSELLCAGSPPNAHHGKIECPYHAYRNGVISLDERNLFMPFFDERPF